eukprot:TRINITY_DN827_c1_g5_i1.p1 TRINITY_DN827_c1_g5~~TRINITY_DN827_c1_g5_i1.p1  ORF type:complete len:358 (+),score=65.48 TRINITY_DN827_c1_g5_i1:149-1075(+)
MSDHYAREASKAVVTQILKNLTFDGAETGTIEALTDVLERYVREIGDLSHWYAGVASRTDTNFHDVNLALGELRVPTIDLLTFAANAPDIPFAKAVSEFPCKSKSHLPAELQDEAQRPQEHIPSFLPPFPDKRTYESTAVFVKPVTDESEIRRSRLKETRQVQRSLAKISKGSKDQDAASAISAATTTTATSVLSMSSTASGSPDVIVKNPYLAAPRSKSQLLKGVAQTRRAPVKTEHTVFMETKSDDKEGGQKFSLDFSMDEAEKLRKAQKCEKILALKHKTGSEQPFGSYENPPTPPSAYDSLGGI